MQKHTCRHRDNIQSINIVMNNAVTMEQTDEETSQLEDEPSDNELTFAEQVTEALSKLPTTTGSDQVVVSPTLEDNREDDLVKQYMERGCGCLKFNGKSCSQQFSLAHVTEVRASCFELTKDELDMVILGQVMAGMNLSDSVVVESRHRRTDRERPAKTHSHQGKAICTSMFRFLHTIGKIDIHLHRRVGTSERVNV